MRQTRTPRKPLLAQLRTTTDAQISVGGFLSFGSIDQSWRPIVSSAITQERRMITKRHWRTPRSRTFGFNGFCCKIFVYWDIFTFPLDDGRYAFQKWQWSGEQEKSYFTRILTVRGFCATLPLARRNGRPSSLKVFAVLLRGCRITQDEAQRSISLPPSANSLLSVMPLSPIGVLLMLRPLSSEIVLRVDCRYSRARPMATETSPPDTSSIRFK